MRSIIILHEQAKLSVKKELNCYWSHPTITDNISPDNQDAYYFPQVAMDDNGNAVIVWQQNDGSGYDQIFKSEYR